MESPQQNWSDDQVSQYLASQAWPSGEWSVSYEYQLYGFITNDGQLWACADDDEGRSRRIVDYLRKTGARRM